MDRREKEAMDYRDAHDVIAKVGDRFYQRGLWIVLDVIEDQVMMANYGTSQYRRATAESVYDDDIDWAGKILSSHIGRDVLEALVSPKVVDAMHTIRLHFVNDRFQASLAHHRFREASDAEV